VVRGEAEAPGAQRKIVQRGIDLGSELVDRIALPHFFELAVERPRVRQVEAGIVHRRLGGLGQHEHRFDRLDGIDCGLPEIERHLMRDVAAKAVDVVLAHPVLHRVDHLRAHLLILIVKVDDIRPVRRVAIEKGIGEPAVDGTFRVVFRMLLDPRVIPGGVVGHPVDDDVHAPGVDRVDERAELRLAAVLGVDPSVVAHGVGRAEGTDVGLGTLLPNRMDGHEPERGNAHGLQFIEPIDGAAEGPFRGEVGNKDFVDDRIIHPVGFTHTVRGRRRLRGGLTARDEEGGEREGKAEGAE